MHDFPALYEPMVALHCSTLTPMTKRLAKQLGGQTDSIAALTGSGETACIYSSTDWESILTTNLESTR